MHNKSPNPNAPGVIGIDRIYGVQRSFWHLCPLHQSQQSLGRISDRGPWLHEDQSYVRLNLIGSAAGAKISLHIPVRGNSIRPSLNMPAKSYRSAFEGLEKLEAG